MLTGVDLNLVCTRGKVNFFAKHPILVDLAHQIAIGLSDDVVANESLNVFVGIHEWVHDSFPSGYNLGIQTEQYWDQMGVRLWNCPSLMSRIRASYRFDGVLELNPNNSDFYRMGGIFMRRKLLLGPYIFPDFQPEFSSVNNGDLLFVGVLNQRRKELINQLSARCSIKVLTDARYDAVVGALSDCGAMLNLHFQRGCYTEWPRLLLAYLAGKVVVSEPLGEPLVEASHYSNLYAPVFDDVFSRMYERFRQEIASKYRFSYALTYFQSLRSS